jgi:hypothetical protein
LLHPTSTSEVKVDIDPATLAGLGAGGAGMAGPGKRHPTFTYDQVLAESSTQRDLYDATAKDGVERFMKGFNVTILA